MKEPLVSILLLMISMFIVVFVCRMWSVRFSSIKLSQYELPGASAEPKYVTKVSNNLNNLFQLPPIFIAACVISISLPYTSDSLIFNAWGFVASRFAHTLVHLTINQVLVRSALLAIGIYFLAAVWVELLSKI